MAAWTVAMGNLLLTAVSIAIVYSLWTGSNNVGFLMTTWSDGESRYEMKLMKVAALGTIALNLVALWPVLSSPHGPSPDIATVLVGGLIVLFGIIPAVFTLWTLSDKAFHDFMEGRYIARLEAKIDAAE